MTRIASSLTTSALALVLAPAAAFALTPGQAYWKAAEFLRSQGAGGWESVEAQPVLLGEAVAGDLLAAGPRSTTLLASLELTSVDARGRRARTLAALGLRVNADLTALMAARTPGSGYGVDRQHLPTALDTALAVQALNAAGTSATAGVIVQALDDLTAGAPLLQTDGMWPLLRTPDATGGGASGDVATTAQVVLAMKRQVNTGNATWDAAFDAATAALAAASPTRAFDRALRLLALLEANPSAQQGALNELAGMQNADGSFGTELLPEDRVYATALAARAIKRAGEFANFPFDSDGDGTADGPDPDSDNDGVCDKGETGAGCTGSDAFPTDPDEWADLDLDGLGDNADLDDDGDGVADASEPGFGTTAQEIRNTDGDALADTADPDDDNDGIPDVDELLAGTDPRDVDTDGDSFRDNLEIAAGKDPLNALDYPRPDGDVFPLGAPDGVVDLRDELLAHRVLRGLVTVPSGDQETFLRHADVAPLVAGAPSPGDGFGAADASVITRRVRGMVAAW
jgi:hypothetical protein